MENLEDKELTAAFTQLAEEAKDQTPTFETMWLKAINRKSAAKGKSIITAVAASVSLIIITSASLLYYKTFASVDDKHALIALTEWKSPTDILLTNNTFYSLGNMKSFPSDRILDYEIKDFNEYIITDK